MWVKAVWVTTLFASLCNPTNSISLDSVRQQNFSDSQTYPSPIYTNPGRPDQPKIEYETKALAKQQLQTVRDIIAADFDRLEKSRQKSWTHDRKVKKEKSIQVTVEDSGFPTLEELRAKCQHLARLYEHLSSHRDLSEDKTEKDEVLNNTSPTPIKLPEVNRTFIPRGKGGFFVTVSSVPETTTKQPYKPLSNQPYPRVAVSAVQSTTHKTIPSTTPTSTTSTTEKMKIRYTKFEPVILQKTILTDGRVMYNWYRSLPTAAVDFTGLPSITHPPQFGYNLMAEDISERSSSEAQTTTTTTERSSWFDPFGLFGGGGGGIQEKEETTTTESTAQPSTTTLPTFTPKVRTVAPITTTPEPLVKIIVPVRYGPIDASHAPQNEQVTSYRYQSPPQQVMTPPHPENVPRFSLGYTGAGYGLGIPYASNYNPDYLNYMRNAQVNRNVDNGRV